MSTSDASSRPGAPARLALSLLGLAVAAGTVAFVATHRNQPEGPNLVYGGDFYRFEASYIVRETGEPLTVDVVVPCQRTLSTYRDRVATRSTLDAAHAPHPWLATAHARTGSLVVSVPKLCEDAVRTGAAEGRVVPKAVWYASSDRLHDAAAASDQGDYASAKGKVEFLNAAVVPSGFYRYAAFVRRRASEGPVAGEATPFGYSEDQVAHGIPASPRRLEASAR
jgi:hypothetical protein